MVGLPLWLLVVVGIVVVLFGLRFVSGLVFGWYFRYRVRQLNRRY